jgi:hypothetical protein
MQIHDADSLLAILWQNPFMSEDIGIFRYHRKNSVVVMYLLNEHAGNKFRYPEGLVL